MVIAESAYILALLKSCINKLIFESIASAAGFVGRKKFLPVEGNSELDDVRSLIIWEYSSESFDLFSSIFTSEVVLIGSPINWSALDTS
ncbi:hypothetical protein D3C87_1484820 [compost metagenome]